MDKQVKVGDKVTALINWAKDVTQGKAYEVLAVYSSSRTVEFWDDAGDRNCLSKDEYEPPQQQDIYLVSGFASEFPTLEAAEQRLTDGYGLHGEEYRIAKLVKTVRVSRVTTTTLGAV
jgi:hypothetical protein